VTTEQPRPSQQLPDGDGGTAQALPPAVVANYSDLSPAMRDALCVSPDPGAVHVWLDQKTIDALIRRGFALPYDSRTHRFILTADGKRARAWIESQDPNPAPEPAVIGGWHGPAAVFDAVQRHTPLAADVARYVAQLRNWVTLEDEVDDWGKGRASAYAMIADHLVGMLGPMAPLIMGEATRRYEAREREAGR
jgi:hypothetical protein